MVFWMNPKGRGDLKNSKYQTAAFAKVAPLGILVEFSLASFQTLSNLA